MPKQPRGEYYNASSYKDMQDGPHIGISVSDLPIEWGELSMEELEKKLSSDIYAPDDVLVALTNFLIQHGRFLEANQMFQRYLSFLDVYLRTPTQELAQVRATYANMLTNHAMDRLSIDPEANIDQLQASTSAVLKVLIDYQEANKANSVYELYIAQVTRKQLVTNPEKDPITTRYLPTIQAMMRT